MNLNIENNKIQYEEGETKGEKTDSDKNIITVEQNTEEKKEIKKLMK